MGGKNEEDEDGDEREDDGDGDDDGDDGEQPPARISTRSKRRGDGQLKPGLLQTDVSLCYHIHRHTRLHEPFLPAGLPHVICSRPHAFGPTATPFTLSVTLNIRSPSIYTPPPTATAPYLE